MCRRIILADPLIATAALTVRWLAKVWNQEALRLIVCTGERMQTLVTDKLYGKVGTRATAYEVKHAKGLSNEFRCYANFECDAWKWTKS